MGEGSCEHLQGTGDVGWIEPVLWGGVATEPGNDVKVGILDKDPPVVWWNGPRPTRGGARGKERERENKHKQPLQL